LTLFKTLLQSTYIWQQNLPGHLFNFSANLSDQKHPKIYSLKYKMQEKSSM